MLPDSGICRKTQPSRIRKSIQNTILPSRFIQNRTLDLLSLFTTARFYAEMKLSREFSFSLLQAGHILGSAMIRSNEEYDQPYSAETWEDHPIHYKEPDT
jgi:hypothetical protein